MARDFEIVVRGADDLERVGRRLKEAGAGDLRRELLRRIRGVTKPVVPQVRAEARSKLPHSGGLAELVANSGISTRTRLTGSQVGVRLVAKNPHDIRRINQGRLRHPVFGNRDVWVSQEVPEGWWTGPLIKAAPRIRREVVNVMRDVSRRITRGG